LLAGSAAPHSHTNRGNGSVSACRVPREEIGDVADSKRGACEVHLRSGDRDVGTVDNLRMACQPKLTGPLSGVSEGW